MWENTMEVWNQCVIKDNLQTLKIDGNKKSKLAFSAGQYIHSNEANMWRGIKYKQKALL